MALCGVGVYCVVLSCDVLCCFVLCCIVLCCAVSHGVYLMCMWQHPVSCQGIESFIFLQFYPICNSESLYAPEARKTAGDPGNVEACNRITVVCRGVWRLAEFDMKGCWRLCRSSVVNGKRQQSIRNDTGE